MDKPKPMTKEIIFKIIGFHKFDNNIDDNDCIAILENGKEIRVDPFVGCAFEYDKREHLLNNWYKAEGHRYEDIENKCPKCFIVREGGFKLLPLTDK